MSGKPAQWTIEGIYTTPGGFSTTILMQLSVGLSELTSQQGRDDSEPDLFHGRLTWGTSPATWGLAFLRLSDFRLCFKPHAIVVRFNPYHLTSRCSISHHMSYGTSAGSLVARCSGRERRRPAVLVFVMASRCSCATRPSR